MPTFININKFNITRLQIGMFAKRFFSWNLLIITLFCACKKKEIQLPKEPAQNPTDSTQNYIYIHTTEPILSLSNYIFEDGYQNGYVGTGSTSIQGTYQFSKADADYAYFKHDSLYLTTLGIQKIKDLKRLELDIQLKNNNLIRVKPVILLYDQFIKNKVIAHRGAWKKKLFPENSIASLKQAIALGCEGSEFDVHLTADKVLVVCHDDSFGGMEIEKSTYSNLLTKKLTNGENIPTLKEYILAAIGQSKTKLQLEIKPSIINATRGLELTDSVMNVIHQLKAQAWVSYTSFSYDILKRVLQDDFGARVIYLSGNVSPAQLKKDKFWGMEYNYLVFQNNESLIKEAQNQTIHAGAWTVNDKNVMNWLLSRNISSISTDMPEDLLGLTK